MIRKLVKQGNNALTVTVPAEWVKENQIKAGDEVSISVKREDLIIHSSNEKKDRRSVVLTLPDCDHNLLQTALISTYTLGYDTIRIETQKDIKNDIEEILRDYLLGFELIKTKENLFEIENVSEPSPEKLGSLFHKSFFSVVEAFALFNAFLLERRPPETKKRSEELNILLDNIEKYNKFCVRIINKKISNLENQEQLFLILGFFTKFKRSFKIAMLRFPQGMQLKNEWNEVLRSLQKVLNNLYTSYYKKDVLHINRACSENKDLLLKKTFSLLPKNKKEVMLFAHLIEFHRLITYMVSPMITVHLKIMEDSQKIEGIT